jgi:hypothetical protein
MSTPMDSGVNPLGMSLSLGRLSKGRLIIQAPLIADWTTITTGTYT